MALFLRPSYRARRLLFVVCAVVLVAVTTQCRMVTDNLTRARVGPAKASSCVAECARVANEATRVESDLHVANVHACGTNQACLDNEEKRHEAAVAAIQAKRKICQNACHHQGGGSGGR